jgi:hypothetical protein
MRLKEELYKKEQDEILDKVIDILELDEENSITLYELDNDTEKQQKILNLIPNIRKYFSYKNVVGIANPTQCKRPYYSIIKFLTKSKYNIYNSDYRIMVDKNKIRTTKYIFSIKKDT